MIISVEVTLGVEICPLGIVYEWFAHTRSSITAFCLVVEALTPVIVADASLYTLAHANT